MSACRGCASSCTLSLNNVLSISYDILTAIISLLDFITDIIVLIRFYNDGRMSFFYASLTILIVAQLSYALAFWLRFSNSFQGPCIMLIVFCCSLLVAPLLSFAFYIIGNNDTALYLCLDKFFSGNASYHRPQEQIQSKGDTVLKKWVESKLMKHIGFIIEALIEAFPQSILQLIAIVYFNDKHNYISIASVLLSLLSISVKSFILSVVVSYNWKSAFFNWISCITDIFGIFFIVSFAFYNPDDIESNGNNPFRVIQTIWFYSILITVVPFVVISSIGWSIKQIRGLDRDDYGWCVIIQIVWFIGLCLSLMLLTISCFVIFAAAFYFFGFRSRMYTQTTFYLSLLAFIKNAKRIYIDDNDFTLSLTKKQNQTLRVCCVNYVLLNRMKNVRILMLQTYLKEQNVMKSNMQYRYCNVTLDDIKAHCYKHQEEHRIISLLHEIRYEIDIFLDDEWLDCSKSLIIYIFIPIYLCGKVFNMLFILFIALYLSLAHNVHIFTESIPLFQTVMFISYFVLLSLWLSSLCITLRYEYYSSFILPEESRLPQDIPLAILIDIEMHYFGIISQPVIQQYCSMLFGKDTADIIMMFCGSDDFADKESRDPFSLTCF